ncbi:MAG: hypothetical protein QM770_07135 [Tepidisphaeraceae bacterium]
MSTTDTPAAPASTSLPYASPGARRAKGFNWRILIFVGVFVALLGYPLYVYLDSALSGGIGRAQNGFVPVDLKAMSSFSMDQTTGRLEDVPARFRELDGKKVKLVGEIAPGGFSSRGDDQYFQLVYSVQKCCYSGAPQIQHFVQATVPPEAVRNIDTGTGGPVEVYGVLNVKITPEDKAPSDKLTGVYHIKVQSVRPL